MEQQQVHELVEDFVRRLGDTSGTEIPPSARLDELGIDSLSLVDLLFALERAFEVSIPDEALPAISTVGDLTGYVVAATR
ncbi:acyl carrier protein [Lentzea sp. JNUCC 0626]|uniref:acyl carrier protein n=1 Tax=Lentzea sp. JNUCC 0626 TaxID=3367513 RepID=UPI003749B7DC